MMTSIKVEEEMQARKEMRCIKCNLTFPTPCRELVRLAIFRLYYETVCKRFASMPRTFVVSEKELFSLQFEYPLLVQEYKDKHHNKQSQKFNPTGI